MALSAFQRNAFQSNAFQIVSVLAVGGDYSTRYSRRRFDRLKEELERKREEQRQRDARGPEVDSVPYVAPLVIAEQRQEVDIAKLFPESAENFNREIASDLASAVAAAHIAALKRRADDELALALLLA